MKTYHWNGEYWYQRTDSLLRRILEWFIWNGGTLRDHYPLSFFGHRITFYGWGWQVRIRHGCIVYSSRPDRVLYFSPNGTPYRATAWWIGTPLVITQAADAHRSGWRDGYDPGHEGDSIL
jgi:hypothetical protein